MPYGQRKYGKLKAAMTVLQTIVALGIVIAFFMALFGDLDAALNTVQWSYGLLFGGIGLLFVIGFVGITWRWLLMRRRKQADEGSYKKGRYKKNW